jgi:hypothetical protein
MAMESLVVPDMVSRKAGLKMTNISKSKLKGRKMKNCALSFQKTAIFALPLFFLVGCSIDPSVLPYYTAWDKKGASLSDVKSALLECGFFHHDGLLDEALKREYVNEFFFGKENYYYLVNRCMEEKLEYRYRWGLPVKELCRRYPEQYAGAFYCQPGAVMEPSKVRRLDSDYCRRMRKIHEQNKGKPRLPNGVPYACTEMYKRDAMYSTCRKQPFFVLSRVHKKYRNEWDFYKRSIFMGNDSDGYVQLIPLAEGAEWEQSYLDRIFGRKGSLRTDGYRLECKKIEAKEPGEETCYQTTTFKYGSLGAECLP